MNATEQAIHTEQQSRVAVWRLGGFSTDTINAENKRQAKAEARRQANRESERRLHAT